MDSQRPGSSTKPHLQSGLISCKPLFAMMNPNSIASSSSPDLPPPSSFHGTQIAIIDLPRPHSIKVKIGQREVKRQKASASISPLTAGKKPKKGKSSTLSMAIPPPPCSECGRQFGTPKALYGHMRCHPQRKWRGMKPPAQIPVEVLEDSVNPATIENTEEAIQAAINIVLLANGEYEEWMEDARKNISKKRNDGLNKETGAVSAVPNEQMSNGASGSGSEISLALLMTDPNFASDLDLDLNLRLGPKEEVKREIKTSNGASSSSSRNESLLPQEQIGSNLDSMLDLGLRLGSSNAE